MTNKKLYISTTSIQTFLQCRKKFKYKYIDKLSLSEKKTSKYISFGSSMHLALADFNSIKDQNLKTLDILHNLLRKNWVRDGYESIQEEKEFGLRGLDMLSNYYSNPKDTGKDNLIIEKMLYKDFNDYTLCGKLDKVYLRSDNTIEILDYKTGNTITAIDNLQLSIYLILANKELGYYPKSVSLYYLPSNKKITESVDSEVFEKS